MKRRKTLFTLFPLGAVVLSGCIVPPPHRPPPPPPPRPAVVRPAPEPPPPVVVKPAPKPAPPVVVKPGPKPVPPPPVIVKPIPAPVRVGKFFQIRAVFVAPLPRVSQACRGAGLRGGGAPGVRFHLAGGGHVTLGPAGKGRTNVLIVARHPKVARSTLDRIAAHVKR